MNGGTGSPVPGTAGARIRKGDAAGDVTPAALAESGSGGDPTRRPSRLENGLPRARRYWPRYFFAWATAGSGVSAVWARATSCP